MTLPFRIVSSALHARGKGAHRELAEALENPRPAQEKLLAEILKRTGRVSLGGVRSWNEPGLVETRERVIFHERTSGSSAKAKEIPYTKSLLRSFEKMFLIWSADVLENAPVKFETGKLFMSISPKIGDAGMADDREYLSLPVRMALSPFLAVDPSLKAADPTTFFQKAGRALVQCSDLEIISVWSPSYFLSLWRQIQRHGFPTPTAVWPKLKMISCWTEGSSAGAAAELKALFPRVWMQGKGLLATEGAMTIPWCAAEGNVPFLTGTYLEGLDTRGNIVPVWEMRESDTYEMLMTTYGGLGRYRIGDRVRVTRHFGKSPVLEFVGRAGVVSDMVGEKLDEAMVREIFERLRLPGAVMMPRRAHGYAVIAERPVDAAALEAELKKIHHYGLARALGQLKPVHALKVTDLDEKILRFWESRGRKRGDVKNATLWTNVEAAEAFLAANTVASAPVAAATSATASEPAARKREPSLEL